MALLQQTPIHVKMSQQQNPKKPAKSSVLSKKTLSKADAQRLMANRKEAFGTVYKENRLARQIFAPEKVTEATNWPEAYSPLGTVCPFKIVTNITATAADQQFSVQAWPDIESCVGVSTGDAVAASPFQGAWSFATGISRTAGESYFSVARNLGDNASYGQVPNDTAWEQVIGSAIANPSLNDDSKILRLRNANGSYFECDEFGVYDLGLTGVVLGGYFLVNFNQSAASTVTQGRVSFQQSADKIAWTNIQQVTSNSNQTENYTMSNTSSQRYFRILYRVNGVGLSGSRSVTNMELQLGVSGLVVSEYQWLSVPGALAQFSAGIFKTFRFVGMTMLVTNTSSDLVNGGRIAGAQLSMALENDAGDCPVLPYQSVASRIQAYDGPLKEGVWGFWTPARRNEHLSLHDHSDDYKQSFLVASGVMASVGASLRVEVQGWIEFSVDGVAGMLFDPRPGRVAPQEIAFVQEVVSHFRTHFCENPNHPKLQAFLEKAVNAWRIGKPYLQILGKAAMTALPAMLAL